MIRYEYENLQGQRNTGLADHIKVRYTEFGIMVFIFTSPHYIVDSVEVVNYLTLPSERNETHKFACDRFVIDGKDL